MKSGVEKHHSRERLMEILVLLLERLAEIPEEFHLKEDLMKGLAEEKGYAESEIEEALAFLLSASEKISHALIPRNDRPLHPASRVFTEAERLRLAPVVRERLLRYRTLGILTETEWEEILLHLLYGDGLEAGEADLDDALRKVVDDERLLLLLPPADARSALMVF